MEASNVVLLLGNNPLDGAVLLSRERRGEEGFRSLGTKRRGDGILLLFKIGSAKVHYYTRPFSRRPLMKRFQGSGLKIF